MNRRSFISLLGGSAVSVPLAARAQRAAAPVIGSLSGLAAAPWADRMATFRRSLGDMGFAEGRNVNIEYRWADGQFERLPAMAADLVRRKVAVLFVAAPDVAIRAAMAATKAIPIVFVTASDPVNFVSNLARPSGNVTGVTGFGAELTGKRLELLHEVVPGASKIALLVNPNNPRVAQDIVERTEAAARQLGLEIVVVKAGNEAEIASGIVSAARRGADALNIGNDAYFLSRGRQIAFLALRHALPTIAPTRATVEAGVLMSYGAKGLDSWREAGRYVGRILKGEKPADLPVLQPTKFELIINQTTATTIELAIPETFLLRADEVIE
jgi:putative ABC transport system substrate-binding protein